VPWALAPLVLLQVGLTLNPYTRISLADSLSIGSAAAGIQSGIGSVAGGSLFAVLQSAGAGGYGVAAVHGVIQAVGVAVGARGIGAWFRGQGHEEGGSDHEDEDGSGDSVDDDSGGKEGSGKDNSTNDGHSKSPN
jgi:hypothetical protein